MRSHHKFRLLLVLALVVLPGGLGSNWSRVLQAAPAADPLYQDNFEDGNYTQAVGSNGLTWQVVSGQARVDEVDGNQQLGVDRGNSLIVTTQHFGLEEYTLRFDARITWSAPGRIVVLYQDPNNYYSVGLGEQAGIYRMLNGSEVQLHEDPQDLVRLPHGSGETGSFKVYVKHTTQTIEIRADRAGDGVDYDIQVLDTNPTALASFNSTAIGMLSAGGTPDPPWFYIDNVAIYAGLILDPYTPVTYYVDQQHPQASDSNLGTESAPWATIDKAAESVKAGDTVIVKSGTYNERITFDNRTRGAPGQLITFKAQPRRSATMWGFYTKFAHYLRIEGFNITTDASLTGWTEQNGVFIDSDHVEIVDNYLYNLESAAISGDSAGVYVANNRIYHSEMGIVISGANWLVEGNEVERLFNYGGGDSDYSRFFGDNHVIRGNYFHGTNFNEIGSAHVDCFQTFDNNGEHAYHILFDGNICYDFHQGFMGEAAYYGNTSDLVFRNNIFAHGGAWGLCVLQIRNVTVLHNVFADIRYHGAGFRDGATGVMRNNIFYNAGSNYWASDGGSVEGSFNLLYEPGATFDPQDFPNDLVNIDPLLSDPDNDDYRPLPGSPAIDAGMNSGVASDIEGTPRPQGSGFDIGAYEFTPALVLSGIPGDQPSPITGLDASTRSYTLTGLTNNTSYTITLNALLGTSPNLTDTVSVMPSDYLLHLPLSLSGE